MASPVSAAWGRRGGALPVRADQKGKGDEEGGFLVFVSICCALDAGMLRLCSVARASGVAVTSPIVLFVISTRLRWKPLSVPLKLITVPRCSPVDTEKHGELY